MDVRYFAGAADAAGRESQTIDTAGRTVGDLIAALATDNEHLGRVLEASSLLADGVRVSTPDHSLDGVGQLDVLPPFAGG